MSTIKVLIGEKNADICDIISIYLDKLADIDLAGACCASAELIDEIIKTDPDVIILGENLPDVAEWVIQMEPNPIYIKLTKPIDIDLLVDRIRYEYRKLHKPDSKEIERHITDVFHNIGIPAHIQGYHYGREAISMVINDMHILNAITKELYPSIAKNNQTTSSRVERSIRHAINVAFTRGNKKAITNLFGDFSSIGKKKPTNGEFIALIADTLRMKLK